MIFLLGLEQLSKDEKSSLLSQIEVLNTENLINDSVQRNSKKGKDFILTTSSKLLKKHLPEVSNNLDKLNRNFDWNAEVLKRKIEERYNQFNNYSEKQMYDTLLDKLKKIADFDSEVNNEILANGIVCRVAKYMKIDTRLYLNNIALENDVFEETLKEKIDSMKEYVKKMNPEEMNNLERLLEIELKKLDECQKEAIRNALNVEKISAKTMINFVRTISTATAVQIILGSFGFGFFLFLSTFMNAIGLLLGMTFPFAAYTAMTATFGFIISIQFLLISLFISTGIIYKLTNDKINTEVAKLLILIGRSKLLGEK